MERQVAVVVSTGGTIASASSAAVGSEYQASVSGRDLVQRVPGLEALATIEAVDLLCKHGFMLTIDEIVSLAAEVRRHLDREEVTAVVVTMGTAAIEEVSFFLDLVVDSAKPVLVTGAMLDTSRLGYDGGRNLYESVRAGLSPEFADQGVLVCFCGEIHSARTVQKLHNTRPMPFVSWPNGPLGLVDLDRIVRVQSRHGRQYLGDVRPVEPVDLVKASLGCDGRQIRFAIAAGARGIVVEGFPGGGGITSAMMEAVEEALAANIPVVVASRAPFGRAIAAARGGAGPADLVEAGAILAESLPPCKARLLLMCALARTSEEADVRAFFEAARL